VEVVMCFLRLRGIASLSDGSMERHGCMELVQQQLCERLGHDEQLGQFCGRLR
jgi:hypothetical protein